MNRYFKVQFKCYNHPHFYKKIDGQENLLLYKDGKFEDITEWTVELFNQKQERKKRDILKFKELTEEEVFVELL